jgi:hypothetical protein
LQRGMRCSHATVGRGRTATVGPPTLRQPRPRRSMAQRSHNCSVRGRAAWPCMSTVQLPSHLPCADTDAAWAEVSTGAPPVPSQMPRREWSFAASRARVSPAPDRTRLRTPPTGPGRVRQFQHCRADVCVRTVSGLHQFVGDLLVGATRGDPVHDLAPASAISPAAGVVAGAPRRPALLDAAPGDRRRQWRAILDHHADRVEQPGRVGVLEQEATGSGAPGLEDVLVELEGGRA